MNFGELVHVNRAEEDKQKWWDVKVKLKRKVVVDNYKGSALHTKAREVRYKVTSLKVKEIINRISKSKADPCHAQVVVGVGQDERRDTRGCKKETVPHKTAPTQHREDSWGPLAAWITGVFSRVSSLQFIDDELNSGTFLFQVILAAGCQHSVTIPPDHPGPWLCGLTTETGALPGLSFKVLQLGFKKHGLSCREGNRGNVGRNI